METRLVKLSRIQRGLRSSNDRLFALLENTLDRPKRHEVWGRVCVCVYSVLDSNPIIILRHLYIKILVFTQFVFDISQIV